MCILGMLLILQVGDKACNTVIESLQAFHAIYNRIIESLNVWVGKDIKDHLVPTPCQDQVLLSMHELGQSPIQPGFENF